MRYGGVSQPPLRRNRGRARCDSEYLFSFLLCKKIERKPNGFLCFSDHGQRSGICMLIFRSFGSWSPISAYRSSYLRRFPPLRMTSHYQSPVPSIHSKGATYEPYQTKSRSRGSDAPCTCDGVFLGYQPFFAA